MDLGSCYDPACNLRGGSTKTEIVSNRDRNSNSNSNNGGKRRALAWSSWLTILKSRCPSSLDLVVATSFICVRGQTIKTTAWHAQEGSGKMWMTDTISRHQLFRLSRRDDHGMQNINRDLTKKKQPTSHQKADSQDSKERG